MHTSVEYPIHRKLKRAVKKHLEDYGIPYTDMDKPEYRWKRRPDIRVIGSTIALDGKTPEFADSLKEVFSDLSNYSRVNIECITNPRSKKEVVYKKIREFSGLDSALVFATPRAHYGTLKRIVEAILASYKVKKCVQIWSIDVAKELVVKKTTVKAENTIANPVKIRGRKEINRVRLSPPKLSIAKSLYEFTEPGYN